MNFLLFALLHALRCYAWLLTAAFIWSSLGNGLTQVVVFGQLLQWQASAALLTLAWLLATVPGFIGSLPGETLCRRDAGPLPGITHKKTPAQEQALKQVCFDNKWCFTQRYVHGV